jgi:TolB-like protein/DNA-binding SARP family transcriptional activator/Flp pilus assembly protein TadD
MPELRILLFGQPRLEVDGVSRNLKRRKVAALLAYLAMAARPQSRDELAELLYPRLDRDRAYADLRQTLSYLKAALGEGALEASSLSVAPLGGPGITVDVAEFRSRISRAGGTRELEDLLAGVKLHRAAFLQGFFLRDSPAFEEWQSGLAEELLALNRSALARLHDLYVDRGSLDQAVECARSIVALDPLDELAQRRLLRTLAAAGRKREAVRHYETFQALLRRELAEEPEEETRALAAGIHSAVGGQAAGPKAARGRRKPFPLAWTLAAAALASFLCALGYYAYRQGYRLFPAVREPSPGGIVVGVLPFGNLSEDPEQEYFCDGLTQDLTTALSSIPGLATAAPSTMFALKGKSRDGRLLGRELGLSHILEGSVRKAGNRIRVNVQLTETKRGHTLWAQKFDSELSGVFEIQDDIVRRVMTELDVRLVSGEQARLWRASTKNGEAYDLYLRALHAPINPEGFQLALSLENQALDLDPDFTSALWHQGLLLLMGPRFGFAGDPARARQRARLAFEKALRLDSGFADAHAAMGLVLFMEGRFAEAEREYELALSLGPHMESTHVVLATFFNWKKDYPKALQLVRRAKELSLFPVSQDYAWEIVILRNMGRLEEALAVSTQAEELFPESLDIVVNHANILRLLKRQDELAPLIQRILELQPDFSAERWVAVAGGLNAEERARLAAEMRKAGFP